MSSATTRNTAHPQQQKIQHQQQHKTLGSLLRYWEGLYVAVEVKTNGRLYAGTLAATDHDMTVTLHDCTVSRSLPALQQQQRKNNSSNNSSSSHTTTLPSVQIRGSHVRYIHFLDAPNVNLAALVQQGKERERAATQKYQRGIRK